MNWARVFWTVAMWTPVTVGVAAIIGLHAA